VIEGELPATDDFLDSDQELCPSPIATILEPDGITASPIAPAIGSESA
jgi:hypothetical protein